MKDPGREALAYQKIGNYIAIDLAAVSGEETAAIRVALDLADLCERIAWDEQIRVVLLGFDGCMNEGLRADLLQTDNGEANSVVKTIAKLRQPVIAAIRGDAMGLGLELALACDIRIGVENARFGLPQIREGRTPSDGGTQRLPRLIGRGRAMQMILTGDPIHADEACRLGLINRIVAPEALMNAATELAREMAEKSPVSLSYVKEALYRGMDLTLDQGIGLELDLYLHLFTTADRTEGIAAYKEKRKPKFEGA